MARSAVNAMRTHSTDAKHAVECVEVGSFGAFVVTVGDVKTRLSVLGCRGDNGVDKDLLGKARSAGFRGPPSCFAGVGGGASFAASVSDLIVTLITCVASAVFSLLDSPFSFVLVVLAPLFAAMLFVFDAVVHLAVRFAAWGLEAVISEPVTSSSLRSTTVAEVHVESDDTAVLTAWTLSCSEAIYVMYLM